jgi:hypothetical protein
MASEIIALFLWFNGLLKIALLCFRQPKFLVLMTAFCRGNHFFEIAAYFLPK